VYYAGFRQFWPNWVTIRNGKFSACDYIKPLAVCTVPAETTQYTRPADYRHFVKRKLLGSWAQCRYSIYKH